MLVLLESANACPKNTSTVYAETTLIASAEGTGQKLFIHFAAKSTLFCHGIGQNANKYFQASNLLCYLKGLQFKSLSGDSTRRKWIEYSEQRKTWPLFRAVEN